MVERTPPSDVSGARRCKCFAVLPSDGITRPYFDATKCALHDGDYSPTIQDEYQRLWHEAAAERDRLRAALAALREES